jgi:HAD superfamily hydrolase (TIGR01459 family)
MSNCRILPGIEPLIERYDGFLLDQWGVLHNGVEVLPGVTEALQALQQTGKKVIILSNSGRRAAANQANMQRMGIDPGLYNAIITSGEAAWLGLSEKQDQAFAGLGKRCLFFSRKGDYQALEGLDLTLAGHPAEADFILLSGIGHDPAVAEDIDRQLQQAVAYHLPMICSNPDITGVAGDELVTCPGALAQNYQKAGGEVHYVGKPWPAIYRIALAQLGLDNAATVAIGDSLQHDIKGAAGAGIDSVLVTAGIHQQNFSKATGEPEILNSLAGLIAREGLSAPQWLIKSFRLS